MRPPRLVKSRHDPCPDHRGGQEVKGGQSEGRWLQEQVVGEGRRRCDTELTERQRWETGCERERRLRKGAGPCLKRIRLLLNHCKTSKALH